MKGLLHSKKFRRNLYKWVIMYVGVIVLLTTVITYSKYVSQMMADDEARVAKFDIQVTANECASSDENSINCNSGTFRPTQEITYYFTLDANTEVKTDIFMTIVLNERFKLKKIEEQKEESLETVSYTENGSKMIDVGDSPEKYQCNTFKAGTSLEPMKKIYRVTVEFDNKYCPEGTAICNQDDKNYNIVSSEKDYDILRVDFSAVQIAK